MHHYLVIYNRREGRIVRGQDYETADIALKARFTAEREFSGQSDIEIVVLGGESWESLHRTHGRYFEGVQELAAAALAGAAAPGVK